MDDKKAYPYWKICAVFAIAIVAVMVLLPTQAAAPADAELATLNHDVKGSCGTTLSMESILASASYRAAHAELAEEPGFVDFLVGHDGVAFQITAIFDVARRDAPLPATPASIEGVPVVVVGDHFQALPALLDDADGALAPPLIPQTCPAEIRPGQRMTSPAGCTFSHVFTDQNGRWYISTAGHCATVNGQRVTAAGAVGTFGTVVYTTGDGGVGNDFALIRVDTDKQHLVNPAMCHWGGPTGLGPGSGTTVNHYGHGIGFGTLTTTRPRTGALSGGGASSFAFVGTASFGDSGSGALYGSGQALGTLTHIGLGTGTVFGTRANHGIALAEANTNLQLTLQTAPLA